MADMVKFQLRGAKNFELALAKMEQKAARNTVTRAVRSAMTPVMKMIQSRIKGELNTMNARARAEYSKNIGLRIDRQYDKVTGKIRTKSVKTKMIAIKHAAGADMSRKEREHLWNLASGHVVNFNPLAHLFEGGVSPHMINQPKMKRTIKHPGIKATPIWADTFDEQDEKMQKAFFDSMWVELKKEWAKIPEVGVSRAA